MKKEINQNQNRDVITLTEEQQNYIIGKSTTFHMLTDNIVSKSYMTQKIFEELPDYMIDELHELISEHRHTTERIFWKPAETPEIEMGEIKILKNEFVKFPKKVQELANEFITEVMQEGLNREAEKIEEELRVFIDIANEIYQFILEIERKLGGN